MRETARAWKEDRKSWLIAHQASSCPHPGIRRPVRVLNLRTCEQTTPLPECRLHAWGDSLEKYATWMEQAGSNGVQRYEFGPMIHKGVEYSIARTPAPDVWKRQSRISGRIRSGQTEAQL